MGGVGHMTGLSASVEQRERLGKSKMECCRKESEHDWIFGVC